MAYEFQQMFSGPSRLSLTSQPPQKDELTDLRLLGRLEAESFDAALRERERREREERLTRLAAGDETAFEPASEAGESSGSVWRLRQEVERLAAFHRAVVHSKGWRLLQAARRLMGRSW
jgi:hypothetical protein